ncbi:MAG: hypothetical protein IKC56_01225 [Clostridia bacterium]|nr:hypothetical protein [Clostridia bacterium]
MLNEFPPVFTRILTERKAILQTALKGATEKEEILSRLREIEELTAYGNQKNY